jgi:hypothetical protein
MQHTNFPHIIVHHFSSDNRAVIGCGINRGLVRVKIKNRVIPLKYRQAL